MKGQMKFRRCPKCGWHFPKHMFKGHQCDSENYHKTRSEVLEAQGQSGKGFKSRRKN